MEFFSQCLGQNRERWTSDAYKYRNHKRLPPPQDQTAEAQQTEPVPIPFHGMWLQMLDARMRFPDSRRELALFSPPIFGFSESIMISLICHSRASSMSAVRSVFVSCTRSLAAMWHRLCVSVPLDEIVAPVPVTVPAPMPRPADTDSLSTPPLPCSLESWINLRFSGKPRASIHLQPVPQPVRVRQVTAR